jgi:dsRNA-specific ribonuclease
MEYQRDVLAQEVGAFAGLRGVKVEKRLELLGDLLLDLVVLGPILQRTTPASEQGKKTRTKIKKCKDLVPEVSPRSKTATM